jgi:hypothetical protein
VSGWFKLIWQRSIDRWERKRKKGLAPLRATFPLLPAGWRQGHSMMHISFLVLVGVHIHGAGRKKGQAAYRTTAIPAYRRNFSLASHRIASCRVRAHGEGGPGRSCWFIGQGGRTGAHRLGVLGHGLLHGRKDRVVWNDFFFSACVA